MVICSFEFVIPQNCITISSFCYIFVPSVCKIIFRTCLNQSILVYISTITSFFKLLHSFMVDRRDAKIQVIINAFLVWTYNSPKKVTYGFLFSTKMRSTKSRIFKRGVWIPKQFNSNFTSCSFDSFDVLLQQVLQSQSLNTALTTFCHKI